MAALSAVLAVIAARDSCSGTRIQAAPSAARQARHPRPLPRLYRHAGREYGVPWNVLAAIGSIETDHGRSRAPGVRSGVNRYGCCAGPMQFNPRDGPPSTWERYGVDANHDGTKDVYDPEDAIPSAANYLRALLRRADGNLEPGDLRLQPLPGLRQRRPRARPRVRATHRRAARRAGRRLDARDRLRRRRSTCRPGRPTCAPPSASPRRARFAPCRPGRWPAAAPGASTPASTTTPSGSCAATTCASPPPAKPATTPTATAPPSTSSPPTEHAGDLGRLRRTRSPTTSAGPRPAALRHPPRLPARARHPVHRLRRLPRPRLAAHLHRRLPRAPAPLLGLPAATAPAASPRPANGSWRSPSCQPTTRPPRDRPPRRGRVAETSRRRRSRLRVCAPSADSNGRGTGKCRCVPGLLGLSSVSR